MKGRVDPRIRQWRPHGCSTTANHNLGEYRQERLKHAQRWDDGSTVTQGVGGGTSVDDLIP